MVSGSVEGRTTCPKLKNDLNTVLTCFSPISKDKKLLMPNDNTEIDFLIATDCISEGQNLQDCDYLINYDIHWNPVRIIQRFGRIDRIGSKNKVIQLVNFWPDVTLDEYINLKAKVETRMKIVDMTATGDDNLLSDEEKTDLEYRKAQLRRLQDEVVDIEDMTTGISIMDLGLNEFRLDLLDYIKHHPDIDKSPFGLHSNKNDNIPEALRKSIEISEKIQEKVAPTLEQQEKIQQLVEGVNIPKFEVSSQALDAMRNLTDNSALRAVQDNVNVMKLGTLQMSPEINEAIAAVNNNALKSIRELSIKSSLPNYQFDIPAIKIWDDLGTKATANLISGLNTFVNNSAMREIQAITSRLGKWLQTIDFSPLTSILENIRTAGFDHDYREVNDVFLKAMFDAKWFPYAGWIANFRIVDEMIEILNTSRASKNRVKRIDRLIFSYYDKDEIDNFKRRWRKMGLPSYMVRILVQTVQAYHRREYALTVSALSTLWEGIIQEKVNDNSYRVSKKTRENLSKLIEENEFDKIFSSFCEEFIFYDCRKVEEVKPDVPGRHGIAHCWYNTYPNRKVALNAILFTDFLLGLKPLDKTEEKENG